MLRLKVLRGNDPEKVFCANAAGKVLRASAVHGLTHVCNTHTDVFTGYFARNEFFQIGFGARGRVFLQKRCPRPEKLTGGQFLVAGCGYSWWVFSLLPPLSMVAESWALDVLVIPSELSRLRPTAACAKLVGG